MWVNLLLLWQHCGRHWKVKTNSSILIKRNYISIADKLLEDKKSQFRTHKYAISIHFTLSAVCVRSIKWRAIQLFFFARDCGSSLKETLFEFFPASHSPASQLLTGQGCLWVGKKKCPKCQNWFCILFSTHTQASEFLWWVTVFHYGQLQAITK